MTMKINTALKHPFLTLRQVPGGLTFGRMATTKAGGCPEDSMKLKLDENGHAVLGDHAPLLVMEESSRAAGLRGFGIVRVMLQSVCVGAGLEAALWCCGPSLWQQGQQRRFE